MLFEFLASDENEQRVASRKAVAVATKRCERFYEFLNQSKGEDERKARFAMIEDDFNEVIARTADEYGVDEERLASSLRNLPIGVDSVRIARKPKMCPYHREVVDISLGTGEAQAGFNAMSQHAYSENSCRGSFDGKCNFKPEMVTQSYWDDKAEAAEQRRLEREQAQQETVQEQEPVAEQEEITPEVDNVPSEGLVAEPTINDSLAEAPSAVASPEPEMAMAASTKEAEALKTVDVDAGSGAEPKMDKRKWTLENIDWDVDAEMPGSPHPTRHQDIVEPAIYDTEAFKEDGRFDQTDAVLEKQDVTQEADYAGNSARGQQGGSFGKGNAASPVTSSEGDARPKVSATVNDRPAGIHGGTFATLDLFAPKVPGGTINGVPYEQLDRRSLMTDHAPGSLTVEHPDPRIEKLIYDTIMDGGRPDALKAYAAEVRAQRAQQQGQVAAAALDPDKNPIEEMAKDDFPTQEEVAQAIADFNG